MANSNKKYSKRRSINKNRNNYAKKNVLNKQSRLSQKGGGCETEKTMINKLNVSIGNLEFQLNTQQKELRETTKKALENLPSNFLQGATDYAKNQPEYRALSAKVAEIHDEDSKSVFDYSSQHSPNYGDIMDNLSKLENKLINDYTLNPDNWSNFLDKLLEPIIATLN
jgi:hypothetical protein